jgi:hypothetical protein
VAWAPGASADLAWEWANYKVYVPHPCRHNRASLMVLPACQEAAFPTSWSRVHRSQTASRLRTRNSGSAGQGCSHAHLHPYTSTIISAKVDAPRQQNYTSVCRRPARRSAAWRAPAQPRRWQPATRQRCHACPSSCAGCWSRAWSARSTCCRCFTGSMLLPCLEQQHIDVSCHAHLAHPSMLPTMPSAA